MIRINLLPFEERSISKNFKLPNRVSLLIYGLAVLVIAAGAAGWFMQTKSLSALQEKQQALAMREKDIIQQTRAIEQLEIFNSLLHERVSLLQQLEEHRYETVEWLNALNEVLPGKLWLVRASRNQGGGRTTLEGVSLGYQSISRLMREMENSSAFSGIQLVRAERHNTTRNSVIHFTVAANWVEQIAEVTQ